MFGHLLDAFVLPQQEKENRLCTNKQKSEWDKHPDT